MEVKKASKAVKDYTLTTFSKLLIALNNMKMPIFPTGKTKEEPYLIS